MEGGLYMAHNCKDNSAIIWQGESLIDGGPTVAIISGLTSPSKNGKTGPMAQVDIIRSDVHPYEAVKLGLDHSICGDCPFRDKPCYVNVAFGPAMKYKAMLNGNIPVMTPEQAGAMLKPKGIGCRTGAYGDPFVVPLEIWQRLHQAADTFSTSYSHQWQRPDFDPGLFEYSMASVDPYNTVEQLRALHPTVRYYRVTKTYDDIDPSTEVRCPSKNDAGERVLQCADCKLCNGSVKAKNVVIVENG